MKEVNGDMNTFKFTAFALSYFFMNYATAFDLQIDKELIMDTSSIEVISPAEALIKVGNYSFSGNRDIRFWSPEDVEGVVQFESELECSLGDCFGRYNVTQKHNLNSGDGLEVISSYSWKKNTDRLVKRLMLILEEAKKRKNLGIFLRVDTLFDKDIVFFIQY